jgi:glycine/D-amino acid oxidase-like deaminating enzyme
MDVDARVTTSADRATGVALGTGQEIAAAQVLVAAGPWTPAIVPRWAAGPPISSIWGVVVATALAEPPAAGLEELGIDRPGSPPDRLFSMVTAGGVTSVGSTFLSVQPDPADVAPAIVERAQSFVPALREASVRAVRSCARPVSFDGRPLIGPIPDVAGLFVCAGHGPWGISTGPASAELVVRQMLGIEPETSALTPSRYRSTSGTPK